MLTLVLATALTAATSAPGTHFSYGGCSGCYGCYGCYGGYPYAAGACYGCSGCWGGSACFGGCFGGCCGGVYGCGGGYIGHGHAFGNGYGNGHGIATWGSLHSAYAGCGGCCGVAAPMYAPAVYPPAVVPAPPVKVIEKELSVPPMKKIEEGGKTIEGDETAARVTVKAAADVRITVNGVRLTRKSETETFLTPALPAGGSFSYTVIATATRGGTEVSETRRVPVAAGATAEADFTALGAARAGATVTVVAARGTPVRVNGTAVEVDGTKTFDTPKLEAGRGYHYTFEADVVRDGKTVTETRRVAVEAGKAVTVDFRRPTAVAGR